MIPIDHGLPETKLVPECRLHITRKSGVFIGWPSEFTRYLLIQRNPQKWELILKSGDYSSITISILTSKRRVRDYRPFLSGRFGLKEWIVIGAPPHLFLYSCTRLGDDWEILESLQFSENGWH